MWPGLSGSSSPAAAAAELAGAVSAVLAAVSVAAAAVAADNSAPPVEMMPMAIASSFCPVASAKGPEIYNNLPPTFNLSSVAVSSQAPDAQMRTPCKE